MPEDFSPWSDCGVYPALDLKKACAHAAVRYAGAGRDEVDYAGADSSAGHGYTGNDSGV